MRIVKPEQRGELKDSQKVKRQAAARLVMVPSQESCLELVNRKSHGALGWSTSPGLGRVKAR